jgi:hypothetical protein
MARQGGSDPDCSWGDPHGSVAAGRAGLLNSRRARLRWDPRDGNWAILLGALCLLLAACAGPIEAVRADPKDVRKDLARSAVSTGEPSWPTRNALYEHGLFDTFEKNPEPTITELHRVMVEERGDPDLLFALAELSFLHGQKAETGL